VFGTKATGCRLLMYIRAAGAVGILHHRVRHSSLLQTPARRGQEPEFLSELAQCPLQGTCCSFKVRKRYIPARHVYSPVVVFASLTPMSLTLIYCRQKFVFLLSLPLSAFWRTLAKELRTTILHCKVKHSFSL
jgi:hypothetical protein